MPIHFEELWEKSERLFTDSNPQDSVPSILDELSMKINLYKMIDGKSEVPEEERQAAKERTFGEILLTLTKLSLKDNVNVFEVLSVSQQYRAAEIKQIGLIPPEFRIPGRS